MSEQRVAAVERALTILDAFADGVRRLSLAELAGRTGYYRSTILRLTESLRRFGYMQRDADGYFSLGPSLLRLGVLYQNTFDLANHVRPVLSELVESTGETAAFYVLQDGHRLCLFRHHSTSPLRFHINEGSALPLNLGSDSQVLLAFSGSEGPVYDEIRERGHLINQGGTNPNTGGVAAPVFGAGGRFVGSLSVAGFRDHFDGASGKAIAELVVKKAGELSQTLGGDLPAVDLEQALG